MLLQVRSCRHRSVPKQERTNWFGRIFDSGFGTDDRKLISVRQVLSEVFSRRSLLNRINCFFLQCCFNFHLYNLRSQPGHGIQSVLIMAHMPHPLSRWLYPGRNDPVDITFDRVAATIQAQIVGNLYPVNTSYLSFNPRRMEIVSSTVGSSTSTG